MQSLDQTNSATKPIMLSKYRIYRLLVLFCCVNVDICFRHKLGCLLRFDIMLRLRAGHKSSIAEVVLNQSDLILPSVNTPQTLASDNILSNRWPRILLGLQWCSPKVKQNTRIKIKHLLFEKWDSSQRVWVLAARNMTVSRVLWCQAKYPGIQVTELPD